ncbi:serine hydrolase domain-containing protein [Marivita sp. S0852]|uniref:serine hydrolase domain-containing protein n=1 Tax=Marivita sp. S0852 TaxID=3373893 RepID=UPI0039824088
MKRFLARLAFGLCAATPVAASDPVALFENWARAEGASDTSITVLLDGLTAYSDHADRPVDLASNSKAITALCVASLVDDGLLRWDMPLAEAVQQDAFDANLAELVTHSAGIGQDTTQLRMGFWLNEDTPRHAHVTDLVLERRQQKGTRGTFSYSNENYALLGRIIELASGQTYEDACRARVLDPAGVSGALSPRFGAFGAWGGWRMTMQDHATLLYHWFGSQGRGGADLLTRPHIQRADGRYYGLGMNYATERNGLRLSHAGALAFPFGPKTGAFAVVYPFGAVVAMGYDVPIADPAKFADIADSLGSTLAGP